jgi:[acyl-carrier-protein] S-malonyltransferase
LINNSDAAEVRSGSAVTDSLIRQVCAPVRWSATIQKLIEAGVKLFVEVGPGKVLSGLVRQTDKTLRTANVEDSASLEMTLALAESLR